ncbi:response regulator transcription factor [Ferroacidibacillus organovorans]|uniref:DNA-binding response regulator n=1 Tax=Ferroacidibacillus organovorans TaxID=1765683 RepID=A0A162UTJ9_9BACL|nr:response regulator transcription factor [Ferroacidibacillus organovorans]KYP82034.1 DNA-binding response regulator [Ferroacidibacillus organovorans]OAG94354.1 two-component system response regulator [Ferroacidibacillus organovorans]OPG15249.1 DNA-binding response regulator [Ferroacidibacillus organovorans]
METAQRIFVIDDDESVRTVMERYLLREGFSVTCFANADSAMPALVENLPDMVILDIMLPGTSGYDLCRWLRARTEVPIIMVSARDEEVDRVLGLELGSDDYLSKPFSPRELVARVRTVLRRLNGARAASVQDGATATYPACADLELRDDERRIIAAGSDLVLTTKEFELLAYFIKNKSRAFTREQLLTQVWGYDFIGDERAIDDLVKRLRRKLTQAQSIAEIVTVWGYGYKLEG